jgi:hypothetical protein
MMRGADARKGTEESLDHVMCELMEPERDCLNKSEQSEVEELKEQHQTENANERSLKR